METILLCHLFIVNNTNDFWTPRKSRFWRPRRQRIEGERKANVEEVNNEHTYPVKMATEEALSAFFCRTSLQEATWRRIRWRTNHISHLWTTTSCMWKMQKPHFRGYSRTRLALLKTPLSYCPCWSWWVYCEEQKIIFCCLLLFRLVIFQYLYLVEGVGIIGNGH